MAIPTIPEAIARGQLSISYSAIDNAKGALFSPRIAAPGSPLTIALVTNILNWGYLGGAQTSTSLRGVANYLVWLCGMYGQQAQAAIQGGGGGSVTPINPGAGMPNRIDFVVAADSFMPTGTTTFTMPLAWQGYVMDFVRGNLSQSTVTTEASYFTYNRTTREFVCSPALAAGELISIIPG
jgi:hypothetical protein